MDNTTILAIVEVFTTIEQACIGVTVLVVVLSVYFIHRVGKCRRIHGNFRVVLNCTATSFLVMCLLRRCIQLLLYFSRSNTDRFYVNTSCVALSLLEMTAAQSSTVCMLMLALEQHLASRWVRTYEERSMSIGVALIGITVFYSSISSVIIHYLYLWEFDFTHSTDDCHPVAYEWKLALLFYTSSFVMCSVASGWLLRTRQYNTKQRGTEFITLSARYQQHENENTAMSITATVVGYLIYSGIGVVGSCGRKVLVDWFGEHSEVNSLIFGYGYLLIELYALFHMACFVHYNHGMRRIVKKDLENFVLAPNGTKTRLVRRIINPIMTRIQWSTSDSWKEHGVEIRMDISLCYTRSRRMDEKTFEEMVIVSSYVTKIHWVVYLLAFALTIYFFYRLVSTKRIHKNFRLVLSCAAGSFVLMTGTRIVVHLMIEWTADVADRYFINITCVTLATIHMIALMGTALCMNMLAVEQHLATIWVNDYEEKSMKVGIILMMIVVVQCVPFGVFINWWYLSDDYDLHNSSDSCIPVDHHWELALMGFGLCFVTCSLCSAWLILLHRYNRRKTAERLNLTSLSARYQQTENAHSNQSIVPSLVGYMLLSLVGLILSFLRGKYAQDYGEANPYGKTITDMGYCSVDLYALYHMFCFMFYNDAMRQIVRRDIGVILCCLSITETKTFTTRVDANLESDTYFNNLISSWDKV